MKFAETKLKDLIREELNEIAQKTRHSPSGFEGIRKMAEQGIWQIENLITKFADDPPEEVYKIREFLESIELAASWQIGAHTAASALHVPGEHEGRPGERERKLADYTRQLKRLHTPAYKRDD